MDIISEKARNYLPYDLETRLHSVRRVVESGWSIRKALSYYKVKRTSFWRWRKRYGGTAAKKAAIEAAHKLGEDVGIKAKCPEIHEEDLDSISRDALKDACYPGNPREATQDEVKALFRKLM